MPAGRQDHHRAEIQSKLDLMLAGLTPSGPPLPTPPPSEPKPRTERREEDQPSFSEKMGALGATTSSLVAKLDVLLASPSSVAAPAAWQRRLEALERDAARPMHQRPDDLASMRALIEAAAPPDLLARLDRLSERLARVETAAAAAADTLDCLVTGLDRSQHHTFEAAKAAARAEVRAAIDADVQPALAELKDHAAATNGQIHAVMALLGTCLERVVIHLRSTEAGDSPLPAAPVPAETAAPASVEAPPTVADQEVASPDGAADAVTASGSRSRLAALIVDLGLRTRAA